MGETSDRAEGLRALPDANKNALRLCTRPGTWSTCTEKLPLPLPHAKSFMVAGRLADAQAAHQHRDDVTPDAHARRTSADEG